MHCKPELNPRTREQQPISSQPLAYLECQLHPRYMQRAEGPVLLFIHAVIPCYGTWDLHYMFALIYSVSLLRASVTAGVDLPGMLCKSAPKAMATFHMELMSIWLFSLQNRVNSTILSLGMPLPVWCPRTGRNQYCSRSKPARAAGGEHLSSELMVEMLLICLKLVLIPTPSIPCWEGTWHPALNRPGHSQSAAAICLFQSLLCWDTFFFFFLLFNGSTSFALSLAILSSAQQAELKLQAERAELGLCLKEI